MNECIQIVDCIESKIKDDIEPQVNSTYCQKSNIKNSIEPQVSPTYCQMNECMGAGKGRRPQRQWRNRSTEDIEQLYSTLLSQHASARMDAVAQRWHQSDIDMVQYCFLVARIHREDGLKEAAEAWTEAAEVHFDLLYKIG